MKRGKKIAIGVLAIVGGWFLEGIAYATSLGGPTINGIAFFSGMAILIGGIVFLFVMPVKK